MTPSAQARALHAADPSLAQAEIARRVGLSRQGVALALAATGDRPGRKASGKRPQYVAIPVGSGGIPARLYDRLVAQAARERVSVRELLVRRLTASAPAP